MAASTLNIRKILGFKKDKSVFMLPHTTPIKILVKEAYKRKIGAVLIGDDNGHCVGIITERDIMRCCANDIDLHKVTAGEIMSKDLKTINLDDDINHVMDIMITSHIRHLPVLSTNGIEGIITIRDLIQAIRQSDKEEIEEFVRYLQSSVITKTNG